MEGVFGFREMMGEEFMGMFLPFFGKMVQKVVMILIQPYLLFTFHSHQFHDLIVLFR